MMNVLIIGSGGREHTLAWKLNQSKDLNHLFICPGNAGTDEIGKNITLDFNNHSLLKAFLLKEKIDMVVVGPEAPLVDGIHDKLAADSETNHIGIIGPRKAAAQLEGSKDFAKKFMTKYHIPTANYKTFNKENFQAGIEFLKDIKSPYVLKADGLAGGKGVIITDDLEEATSVYTQMINENKFGEAGNQVVIEEFLSGVELSVFVLTDGKSYVLLPEAKDYKRIGEGDTGLNTGGMGSISPVPFADDKFMKRVIDRVIEPTINGLQNDKLDYQGFIFFGLINVNNNPYVIEYNVRLGDPETESVLPRIKTDLLDLFQGVTKRTLSEYTVETDNRVAASVMMVAGGYPEAYKKGLEITGLEKAQDQLVFHAGTKKQEDKTLTNGGRILAITSFGKDMQEALNHSYKLAENINYTGKYYRTDLGFDI